VNDINTESNYSPTLWERLKAGFIAAHKRRPLSFYLLLIVPVVLFLGAHIFHYRTSPQHFTLMVTLMLVFFWLISVWALNDFFALYRKHRAEKRALYLETIGDPDFAEQLGRQVRSRQNRP
jgi:hypothetical protein